MKILRRFRLHPRENHLPQAELTFSKNRKNPPIPVSPFTPKLPLRRKKLLPPLFFGPRSFTLCMLETKHAKSKAQRFWK